MERNWSRLPDAELSVMQAMWAVGEYPAHTADLAARLDRGWKAPTLLKLLSRLEEWGRNSQRVYMDRAMDYITAHFSDSNLSLNEVSSHVGLSVSYLSTLFSKYQPPGFSHYLRQYRIEQARLLLQSTDASVTEIGYRTGFNSSNSFIRTFKSLVGETPGKFRDSRRGQAD